MSRISTGRFESGDGIPARRTRLSPTASDPTLPILQAKKNARSMNEECEHRLRQSRDSDDAKPLLDELRALLAGVRRK